MTERAAHLVDEVLPWVPVRQWVLTVPYRRRYQMAWTHGLSRAVLRVSTRVLGDVYRRGARGRGIDGGQTGMVTALQRRAEERRSEPPIAFRPFRANIAIVMPTSFRGSQWPKRHQYLVEDCVAAGRVLHVNDVPPALSPWHRGVHATGRRRAGRARARRDPPSSRAGRAPAARHRAVHTSNAGRLPRPAPGAALRRKHDVRQEEPYVVGQ